MTLPQINTVEYGIGNDNSGHAVTLKMHKNWEGSTCWSLRRAAGETAHDRAEMIMGLTTENLAMIARVLEHSETGEGGK